MSTLTLSRLPASCDDIDAPKLGSNAGDQVVEINLLLPARWAQELIELSRKRQESVGQILRSMIGHVLDEGGRSI
jgi:hypothetical protein